MRVVVRGRNNLHSNMVKFKLYKMQTNELPKMIYIPIRSEERRVG